MQSITDQKAREKGTFAVDVSFYDEDGSAVIPTAVNYSLVDENNNTINGLANQPISPAATVTIVLKGDDLQIQADETDEDYVLRYLVVEGTYDSVLGTDLPVKEQVTFVLENLKKVS